MKRETGEVAITTWLTHLERCHSRIFPSQPPIKIKEMEKAKAAKPNGFSPPPAILLLLHSYVSKLTFSLFESSIGIQCRKKERDSRGTTLVRMVMTLDSSPHDKLNPEMKYAPLPMVNSSNR